jgi:hypothetical protein
MAKRVARDERPYRPVEEALVRSVMSKSEVVDDLEIVETQGTPEPSGAVQPSPASSTLHNNILIQSQSPEKLSREKRVLLSPSEEREIERLVARIAEAVGTPVKLSHLLRAYMTLLLHAENEIIKRAQQAPPMRRPPNGDPIALASFEQRVAQILSAALREAAPLR